MGTKNNPGSYDCYKNAAPDEPMFILLGRDRIGGVLVLLWCYLRVAFLLNKPGDPQIVEARGAAGAMLAWCGKTKKPVTIEEAIQKLFPPASIKVDR
jgi:hypothetical protein